MAINIKNKEIISSVSSGIALITLMAVLPLAIRYSENGFRIFTIFYFTSIALAMLGGVLGVLDIHNPNRNPAAIGLFLTFTIFVILLTIALSMADYVHGF